MTSTRTHKAVVTVAARAPLELATYPTVDPGAGELLIRVEWTAATPLHLHQADGGLLIQHPAILGSTMVGVVVQVGPEDKSSQGNVSFEVGDRVFGFCPPLFGEKARAFQEYATVPSWCFGKVPRDTSAQEAATLPENFVTVFNTLSKDLNLDTPWPKPENYRPTHADTPILIWGAASSVGQYALQILKFYGYKRLIVTASAQHHAHLQELGASACFDYRSPSVVQDLLKHVTAADKNKEAAPVYPLIIDCIGSQAGSLSPLSRIPQSGSIVAVMLPVILKRATEDQAPEYSMDVEASAKWADGVVTRGVRTHFFAENYLQREVMPTMLAQRNVVPNRFRVVEGATMLERANNAIRELRRGVSGEKLIWRVSDE
ncbi:chaperonin 10-like protein [Microdochium trichocladiopsis]|uniref:Chaperonin 10-like protein n=1 Tax=Microdochium trichocladiopsis TaxID=1682393 RepID=A0A9P9BWK1_9PEZI|nr:chaperonin 10-like protein [Microdochium trichocladiopsis]KAH7041503.1 chaperonin 10-like protein [Microdochium trichocladiopsis]